MQQLFQRPENHIPRIVILFRPRLNQKMNMIRHHARCKELVTFVVKVPQRIECNRASFR